MLRSLPLFAFLSLLAILSISAQADFITVSGDVSGVWDVDSVIVTGEVRVPPGETLQIMPGVEVLFQVYCKFIVNRYATLIAIGTSTDSIRFDGFTSAVSWQGIRFLEASDSSYLAYCYLTHGYSDGPGIDAWGGAILCYYSNPTIENCQIDSCIADYGGAIACWASNPKITNNAISGNSSFHNGGAIACELASSPSIVGNIIGGNSSADGGGIYLSSGSRPVIKNNYIISNAALYDGGGILLAAFYSDAYIVQNLIVGNSASGYGGGIFCGNSSPYIVANLILENSSFLSGGGIFTGGSECHPAIVYNLVARNQATGFGSDGGGLSLNAYWPPIPFHNNVICENHAADQGGGIALWESSVIFINDIVQSNTSYASPEIFMWQSSNIAVSYSNIQDTLWPGPGNISADPLFVNPEQNDYRLLWGSPCIDSGDPNPQYNDPDSSRSDMGAFYYDQSVPVRVLLTPYNAPIQIPPEGGSFDYAITASNCTGSPLAADFWCNATVNDSLVGPLFGPQAATIPANDNISVLRTQRVPGGGPRSIVYNGYAAVGPDTSRDSFTFWRLAAGNAELATSNWSNWGDWFDVGARRAVPASGSRATPTMEFALYPCSPNPFNATTAIRFHLPVASRVKLEVFDIAGRNVGSGSGTTPTTGLIDGWRQAGSHEITFDASNLASGVYLARLTAGEFTALEKLVLLK